MEQRAFGKTGLQVSVLGFGGAEIGFEGAPQSDVDRLLASAIDGGLNVIDTAECYVNSEELIGTALRSRRDKVHLFTKCGHDRDARFGLPDWHPDLLRQQIDRSLTRLKTDHVELLQLHSCDEETLRQGDVVEVLQEARAAGKTRFIGYSGDNEPSLFAVESGVFDALQTTINIADQRSATLTIPKAEERGMAVIAKRSVANVAWWNGSEPPNNDYARPYWERLKILGYDFLTRQGKVEIVGTALRFVISVPGVDVALVGTTNPSRWLENWLMITTGHLSATEYETLRGRWEEVAGPDWVTLT